MQTGGETDRQKGAHWFIIMQPESNSDTGSSWRCGGAGAQQGSRDDVAIIFGGWRRSGGAAAMHRRRRRQSSGSGGGVAAARRRCSGGINCWTLTGHVSARRIFCVSVSLRRRACYMAILIVFSWNLTVCRSVCVSVCLHPPLACLAIFMAIIMRFSGRLFVCLSVRAPFVWRCFWGRSLFVKGDICLSGGTLRSLRFFLFSVHWSSSRRTPDVPTEVQCAPLLQALMRKHFNRAEKENINWGNLVQTRIAHAWFLGCSDFARKFEHKPNKVSIHVLIGKSKSDTQSKVWFFRS